MPFPFKHFNLKKFLLFAFVFIILCSGFFSLFFTKSKTSFRSMTNRMFLEDIATDTLSLHYTLAYPDKYSLNSYPVTLPRYSKKNLIQTFSKLENNMAALSRVDKASFTSEEAYCYGLLQDYFDMRKRGISYTYLEECFSPSSGIVANYPVLMAEYSFRTKKDVTDYLTLLSDTPHYFSSYLQFQKERAEKGYFLASASMEETIEQCDTIITKEALDTDSHFLCFRG